jgi:hypothetical protein
MKKDNKQWPGIDIKWPDTGYTHVPVDFSKHFTHERIAEEGYLD